MGPIRQWYKRFGAPALSKDEKESEEKSNSGPYQAMVEQVVQQQVNTLAEALDNGYTY